MILEQCIEELPQYQQLKANQSTVLGWQLAGSARDQDELDSTCAQLNNGAYAKWGQENLMVNKIKQPVCSSRDSTPNATLALPSLVAANTKTFTTLLLNAFPSTNRAAWSYLCDNLRFVQLDGFLLSSTTIISSVCSAGSEGPNPQPFSAVAGVNETAVKEFQDANARLFAYITASAASSQADLEQACARAPERKDAWKTLLLNATAVEETLCSIKSPLSVSEAKAKITEWTSKLFAVVVENISNAAGYRQFLCETLNCEGMTNVGMDGELVRQRVCESRKAAS